MAGEIVLNMNTILSVGIAVVSVVGAFFAVKYQVAYLEKRHDEKLLDLKNAIESLRAETVSRAVYTVQIESLNTQIGLILDSQKRVEERLIRSIKE